MDSQQPPYSPNGYGTPEGGFAPPPEHHQHAPHHAAHPEHGQQPHPQHQQPVEQAYAAGQPAWQSAQPAPVQPPYHQPYSAHMPLPPQQGTGLLPDDGLADDEPVAVVKVLSVRGVEYLMMSIALWVGAATFAGVILSLINGGTGFDVLAFPISALIVSVGLFAFFFLRLKKAELRNPRLRFDPSKRRLSQITQVLAYLAIFVSLVGVLYSIIAQIGGSYTGSLWKIILDFLIVLVIAGGILYYYWRDEHRGLGR